MGSGNVAPFSRAISRSSGKVGELLRRPRLGEEAQADFDRRLVAGAGRDQAADELLERRAVAPVAQVEHRRLRQLRHGPAQPLEDVVDVEGFFAGFRRDWARLGHATPTAKRAGGSTGRAKNLAASIALASTQ